MSWNRDFSMNSARKGEENHGRKRATDDRLMFFFCGLFVALYCSVDRYLMSTMFVNGRSSISAKSAKSAMIRGLAEPI